MRSVKFFFPKHNNLHMNLEDESLARSLDPYGKLDLLPRTYHWLDPKSRACMWWNVASTTSYTIRSFGLFGYLRVVCLEIISVWNIHNSSQATPALFPNFAPLVTTDYFRTIYSICQVRPLRSTRPHALTAFIHANQSSIFTPSITENGSICSHS